MHTQLEKNLIALLDEIIENEAAMLAMVHGMKEGLEKTIDNDWKNNIDEEFINK